MTSPAVISVSAASTIESDVRTPRAIVMALESYRLCLSTGRRAGTHGSWVCGAYGIPDCRQDLTIMSVMLEAMIVPLSDLRFVVMTCEKCKTEITFDLMFDGKPS